MQEAPGTRRTARRRRIRKARALAGALAAVLLAAGCGLKGSLTLPEKPSNVVIRPGPGGEQVPGATPAPKPEPLPPPELPPDTRGNTLD
jgi:predicted small lipoprotein YifL